MTPGAGGWGLSLSWDNCSVNQSCSVLSSFEIAGLAVPHYVFQQKGFLSTKSVWCVALFVFSLSWRAGGVSVPLFRGVSSRCQQCTSVGLVRWGQKGLSPQGTALVAAASVCGWACLCFTGTSSCNYRGKSGINTFLAWSVVTYNTLHPF